MDVVIIGMALAVLILSWVFFGYTLCSLNNTIEDLMESIEHLSDNVECIGDSLKKQK